LEWPSGELSVVVPYPGFSEKPGVPVGDDAAAKIARFDSAGRQVSVPVPGRITPGPPVERLERREVPIPPARMPPLPQYDVLFRPGESALNSVDPGLQPGEGRSGDKSIPQGP